MNSWKKVALGGASVLAIATLAACGNSASSNKSSSTSTNPKDIKGNVTLMSTQQLSQATKHLLQTL